MVPQMCERKLLANRVLHCYVSLFPHTHPVSRPIIFIIFCFYCNRFFILLLQSTFNIDIFIVVIYCSVRLVENWSRSSWLQNRYTCVLYTIRRGFHLLPGSAVPYTFLFNCQYVVACALCTIIFVLSFIYFFPFALYMMYTNIYVYMQLSVDGLLIRFLRTPAHLMTLKPGRFRFYYRCAQRNPIE